MSALERRIAKIEASIQPAAPLVPHRLMAQPRAGATDEEWAKYIADRAEAEADGFFVIELVPVETSP